MLSRQLGNVSYFSETEERELLDLKKKWGWADPRNTDEYKNCDICANDIFRESWKQSGVQRRAFPAPPAMAPAGVTASVTSSVAANLAASVAANVAAANGAPPVLKAAPGSAPTAAEGPAGLDMEQLVQLITAQVMRELQK
jgi:L-fuculose-phosphate aldolase